MTWIADNPTASTRSSRLYTPRCFRGWWAPCKYLCSGLTGFTDDQAYRAMDFLLDALPEIAAEIFGSVAHLLNLDLDIVFVDSPANPPVGSAAVG